MKRKADRTTREVDAVVGGRIRERRLLLGLSQQQLADLIGVTYQQAHKYERGINRVSAGRLFEIARVLSVPVAYFFETVRDGPRELSPGERMQLDVARNFADLSPVSQGAVANLVRRLAEENAARRPLPLAA